MILFQAVSSACGPRSCSKRHVTNTRSRLMLVRFPLGGHQSGPQRSECAVFREHLGMSIKKTVRCQPDIFVLSLGRDEFGHTRVRFRPDSIARPNEKTRNQAFRTHSCFLLIYMFSSFAFVAETPRGQQMVGTAYKRRERSPERKLVRTSSKTRTASRCVVSALDQYLR